jgi:large subunit ribosomal protein L3
MKFILARKLQMTRVFGEDGRAQAGTILSAAPVVVTQVKTAAGSDKYDAVQIGEGSRKTKNISKAVLGHSKGKAFKAIKEFRTADAHEVGAEIKVDQFAVGDVVAISGTTKGKGFAGVVKRHGFHGGRRTHGQKHSEREPGSIGGSGGRAGGRVAKGIRMAGRMGGERVTVKNLKVLAVDPAANLLIVSGAVPGNRGALLEVVSQ